MRRFLLLALTSACSGGGGEGIEVQESNCQVGRFYYEHDLKLGEVAGGTGSLTISGQAFFNAGITDANGNRMNGKLELLNTGGGGPSTIVSIEFEDLLAENATVDARGHVRLDTPGIHAGNCETAGFSGRITDIGDGWKFTLVDLRASPFCSGSELAGSFAGCVRTGP